jgi:hypothetical protein
MEFIYLDISSTNLTTLQAEYIQIIVHNDSNRVKQKEK